MLLKKFTPEKPAPRFTGHAGRADDTEGAGVGAASVRDRKGGVIGSGKR